MRVGRYHIVFDLVDVSKELLGNIDALDDFLKKLPGIIGMKILKGPEIVVGVPKNPGLTGFVIIDFSHISVHTFEECKQASVDIFSCKPYDKQLAIDAVLQFFQAMPEQMKVKEVAWK